MMVNILWTLLFVAIGVAIYFYELQQEQIKELTQRLEKDWDNDNIPAEVKEKNLYRQLEEELKWLQYQIEFLADWEDHAQVKYLDKEKPINSTFDEDMKFRWKGRVKEIANREDMAEDKVVRKLNLVVVKRQLNGQ